MGKKKTRDSAGRPRLSDKEKRSLPVEFRVNGGEKKKLLMAAKTSGMPLATWMRSNLLAAATRQLKEHDEVGNW